MALLLTPMLSLILCQEKSSVKLLARKIVMQSINIISLLPTCDLIFYFPLHMQRLHIDSAVANKSCTRNPSVRLTESIFFVLISKNRAQTLEGGCSTHLQLALTARCPRQSLGGAVGRSILKSGLRNPTFSSVPSIV